MFQITFLFTNEIPALFIDFYFKLINSSIFDFAGMIISIDALIYIQGIIFYIVLNACVKSAFKSSTSSIPTDKRIKSPDTPAEACSASFNC